MQKNCKQCANNFNIFEEDITFLKAMSEKSQFKTDINLPNLCPECRQQRRMSFRNERKLYERKCDVTGKKIISIFPPTSRHKVYDMNHWYSDKVDHLEYGREYNFSEPFFVQMQGLLIDGPWPSLRIERSENCDYNSDISDCANCYLCSRTHKSTDMLYTYRGSSSTSCTDCYQAMNSELLHESVECIKCYGSNYLFYCTQCIESSFLWDCHGCSNCFLSTNLRKKQYYFLNEPYAKEQYEEKVKAFMNGSYSGIQKALEIFQELKKKAIKKNLTVSMSEECSGDNISQSKNCFSCFGVKACQDGRYLWDTKDYHDAMDAYSGGRDSELIYEATSTSACWNCKFCMRVTYSNEVDYSLFCNKCKNCFGCFGLRNKQYCILNKQYTKEEYEALVPKIIEHMKSTGEWGEFFPSSLSPFGYNDTVAHEYYPLTREQVLQNGWNWSDYQSPLPTVTKFLPAEKLPDNINETPDEILSWAIKCEKSGRPFRVTAKELKFYRQKQIPIPRLHPDERHRLRFNIRNPLKLRNDRCTKCHQEVITTFPVDTENIYCEACYNSTMI